jgi:saccharopine dehydrogenase-like NADP-dependent oxidoreductase
MKKILILGAGMSATSLIQYLLDKSTQYQWKITLADLNVENAKKKLLNHPNGTPKSFNIEDDTLLSLMVQNNDLVISLLPAKFHIKVAQQCLNFGKHLFTTSYVSPEMKAMHQEAQEKGLLFFNECGVDPGIDHMSAMKIIHHIQSLGGKLIGFESNTGGLIAPQFDNNPWNYKFTWNPRNVIIAGQAGAKYLQNNKYKYIPYHQLFKRTHRISVLDYGEFDVYANRDSLMYRSIYGLENIQTLFRGTLRRPGYCQSYDAFIQLGMTNDSYVIENSNQLTYRDFVESFLPHRMGMSVEDNFCFTVGIDINSEAFKKFSWLGLFENTKITFEHATPAQILQSIIEPKWKLENHDLDMIVMQHRFVYELNGKNKERKSSMVIIGKNPVHTAMSITVGTPLAIAVKAFLINEIQASGVVIPVEPHIYNPILDELEQYGITFIEEEQDL